MIKNLLGIPSGFFKESTKEKWQSALEAGLTEVELNLKGVSVDDILLNRATEIYTMLVESGLNISSCHLPNGDLWDISMLDEIKCSSIIKNIKNIIDWAASKNIGIAVIHGSAEPIKDDERSARLTKSADSIKELGMYAKERGIILAVENLPRTSLGNYAEDMLVLTDNGKSASICFDVNHLFTETHQDFYEKVAPHIATTHLSDYDGVGSQHWLPGDGCIDWAEIVRMFEKFNYNGRYIFETKETYSPKLNRAFSPVELVERFTSVIK